MKLYIPALGDRIKLTADWTFLLFPEYRNEALYSYLGIEYPNTPGAKPVQVTLQAGTELSINRIHIRHGNREFDSITFSVIGAPPQKRQSNVNLTRVRFWAKLADVNTIEFESILTRVEEDDEDLRPTPFWQFTVDKQ